ncbi:DUF1302 domain-containing protein [Acidobacteria bacterium AH-259-L09]|nr:DUF1302 domain-containing protein [Acidobacteria bacterium AH-259-L09]
MNSKPANQLFRWKRASGLTALAAAISVLFFAPAQAEDFQKGDLFLSWDNTLSYGVSFRLEDPDSRIIGLASGGTAFSVNGDDGNLNYGKGLVSNTPKIISELEINYRNFGAFVRAKAFYDIENEHGDRKRTPLSLDALHRVGGVADLLDAYVWARFDIGSMPAQIRFGRQVLSWGESTFIQNSINVINPVDVSALRVPGAELREALIPEAMVMGTISPTDNISLEGFYLLGWNDTEIDPPGSYFSTTDIAGEGAEKIMLGFGLVPDSIPVGAGVPPIGVAVPREPDELASDSGQYGAALRAFLPALNQMELGFFFINYHSRLPIINARTGTLAGLLGGDYAASAAYFISYPEDIKLFGASYSTEIGNTGVALQGEFSQRWDVPLQVDDVELLFASLSPLALVGIPLGTLLANTNQIGAFGFNEVVAGSIERNVSQFQSTATKVFGPMLGAEQTVLVSEVAVTYVNGMPDKDTLRLEVPATYTGGNPIHTALLAQPATEPAEFFADDTSWGYRVAGRLDYNRAIGAINLSPRFSWQQDVSGNSPGPGGNFIEGRKAFTVGLTGMYLNTWEVDINFTTFFGAGRHNLINDRDFLGLSVKYLF